MTETTGNHEALSRTNPATPRLIIPTPNRMIRIPSVWWKHYPICKVSITIIAMYSVPHLQTMVGHGYADMDIARLRLHPYSQPWQVFSHGERIANRVLR